MSEVAGAGQHWTDLSHAQSTSTSTGAPDAGLPFWTELLLLFVQTTLEDTAGAGGAAFFGVNLGIFTMNYTLDVCLCDDSFLAAASDARLGGSGPVVSAVVGSAV